MIKDMLADLQGQIERITYTNDENGYTIAKLKVYGHLGLVTITGNLMAPNPGEIIKMKGEWVNHPKYGEQFKIIHYKTMTPASVYGIEKYLGSGLIKDIGFIIADNIAEKLGFAKDSELRAEAGILYVLNQLSDDGHVCYPYEPLIKKPFILQNIIWLKIVLRPD